jgi:2-oxoisovalerate dehydrogenase E1 component
MATQEREILEARDLAGLSPDQLLRFYRTMYTSRRIDDREINLKRQNRTYFQISSAGHEAVGVAVAEHCRPGHDWFFLYYRDRALALALGQSPLEQFLQAVGAASDHASGGRQMPAHWGDVSLNIPTGSSPTGTQFLQAVGAAEGGAKIASVEGLSDVIDRFQDDEIVVVCTGDGATSEGEFWESLNAACLLGLPVV